MTPIRANNVGPPTRESPAHRAGRTRIFLLEGKWVGRKVGILTKCPEPSIRSNTVRFYDTQGPRLIISFHTAPFKGLLQICCQPSAIADRSRRAIANSEMLDPTARLAVLLPFGEAHMFKGILIAGLVLLAAALLDQYLAHGLYTDATMSMLRQMRHSFRV
jgi:hypothetical protein